MHWTFKRNKPGKVISNCHHPQATKLMIINHLHNWASGLRSKLLLQILQKTEILLKTKNQDHFESLFHISSDWPLFPTQTLGSPYIGIFLVDGGRSLLGAAIGAWCKLMDGVCRSKRYLRQNRFVETKLRIAKFYIQSQANTIWVKIHIELQSMKKSLTRNVIVFNDSSEPLERNCK